MNYCSSRVDRGSTMTWVPCTKPDGANHFGSQTAWQRLRGPFHTVTSEIVEGFSFKMFDLRK